MQKHQLYAIRVLTYSIVTICAIFLTYQLFDEQSRIQKHFDSYNDAHQKIEKILVFP